MIRGLIPLFLFIVLPLFAAKESVFLRDHRPLHRVPAESLRDAPWIRLVDGKGEKAPFEFLCSGRKTGFEFRLRGSVPLRDARIEIDARRHGAETGRYGNFVFRVTAEERIEGFLSRRTGTPAVFPLHERFFFRKSSTDSEISFCLNFSAIFALSGVLPIAPERCERWSVDVRIFQPGEETPVFSLPPDCRCLCEFPRFSVRELAGIRSEIFRLAVFSFFNDKDKTNGCWEDTLRDAEPKGFYLTNYIGPYYAKQKFYTENCKIPPAVSFPIHQSWKYYLTIAGGDDPAEKIMRDLRDFAQRTAERIREPLTGEEALEEGMAVFTNLRLAWGRLRFAGLRNRMFTSFSDERP